MTWRVLQGDCIEELKALPANSFDAVVTDPPYALDFMGKSWDSFGGGKGFQAWCEEWSAECLRVLKPGGHMLAFGGTRTYHRMACAIEDAGFEIRDSLHWIYGSGFPKSLDVSKAIDKAAGAEREVIGRKDRYRDGALRRNLGPTGGEFLGLANGIDEITAPSTPAAKQWQGYGTALKPAHEPIVLARKPFTGTVANNVVEYGTGGINVDACRVGNDLITAHGGGVNVEGRKYGGGKGIPAIAAGSNPHTGRWPPNVLLSGDAVSELDRQSGNLAGCGGPKKVDSGRTSMFGIGAVARTYERAGGGASRFFPCFKYQAKASKRERPTVDGVAHPTVKPVELMRWLVRLVTPLGGTVLDPFGGTGTTAAACELEGFDCVLVEREPDYVKLINARMGVHADASRTAT